MAKLTEDLSKITSIPYSSLKKIEQNIMLCIAHEVEEAVNSQNTQLSIETNIGKLNISFDNNELKYKFIPSQNLNNLLIETINTKESPLINKAENILKDKIINLYKELL